MALALTGTPATFDGRRCKIVEVTDVDNAAANQLAVTFAAAGMTDFQGNAIPTEIGVVCTASAADVAIAVAIIAVSAAGFTIRKLTAGGAANAKVWRVTLRNPRGIAA